MSEYLTTTGEVRDAFIEAGLWTMNGGAALKAFEQWLDAHDAEVWDRAKAATLDCVLGPEWDFEPLTNPYNGVTSGVVLESW